MRARELGAAFETLPGAWRKVLSAWTPERLAEVIVTALVECRTVTLAELELERDADDWDAED